MGFRIILCFMRVNVVFIALLLGALLLTGCGLFEDLGDGTAETPTAAASTPTPEATADPQSTPDFAVPVTPTPAPVDLKLWIPSEVAVRTEAGAAVFAEQLLAFNARHPDVAIEVEQKPISGPGGILSYLRTGRDVAPSVLPDMIAIPTDLLPGAAVENLVFPLDEQQFSSALEPLFPAAQLFARPQEQLLGYPFALTHLPHLVYNSNVLTDTLPLTWDRLISDTNRSMVFAADGTDGALLALQFYLDAGGTLTNDLGQAALDLEPLTLALSQIEAGRQSGFILPQSSTVTSQEQAWQIFLLGSANIVRTSPEQFLTMRSGELPLGFTVTGGMDRPLTPLVNGWAWAISTTDPAERALAEELLAELIEPTNLGNWSRENRLVPSRRDAFTEWPTEDIYIRFVRQELERAQPLPVTVSGRLFSLLSDAVFQVTSGSKTAAEAAAEAVAAIEA